ncbi:5-formyltetrahydrofolate cyclo-ligase [Alteromonadaceae bacterium 2753L.S.0a.02]|nr:5-formyltetrahydrofolate cyclo-ligase [Alteromonadaceae bacterium 2753L.S.0a.02]
MSKSLLRAEIRKARRALSPQQQKSAAIQLGKIVCAKALYHRAQHIALYIANDGEISPHEILSHARRHGKHCYLPALAGKTLHFREYPPGGTLTENRFGIPEPIERYATVEPEQLDLVLLPLVAFDAQGNRLGMGGGFYDRTFSFKLQQPSTKPTLIGLAHALQQQSELSRDNWDIPLNAIATEAQWLGI